MFVSHTYTKPFWNIRSFSLQHSLCKSHIETKPIRIQHSLKETNSIIYKVVYTVYCLCGEAYLVSSSGKQRMSNNEHLSLVLCRLMRGWKAQCPPRKEGERMAGKISWRRKTDWQTVGQTEGRGRDYVDPPFWSILMHTSPLSTSQNIMNKLLECFFKNAGGIVIWSLPPKVCLVCEINDHAQCRQ